MVQPSRLLQTLVVVAAFDRSLGIGATGSHVPYERLVELRAAYTPDVPSLFRPYTNLMTLLSL